MVTTQSRKFNGTTKKLKRFNRFLDEKFESNCEPELCAVSIRQPEVTGKVPFWLLEEQQNIDNGPNNIKEHVTKMNNT
jgi:hypothetical protein